MDAMLFKRPSAWLPIGMSLGALAVVFVHIAQAGIAPQADEGTAAHLWQLLMAGQVLAIGFFALRWLPAQPIRALQVLAIQLVFVFAAVFPVWWFRW